VAVASIFCIEKCTVFISLHSVRDVEHLLKPEMFLSKS